jgi:hypothetical protein
MGWPFFFSFEPNEMGIEYWPSISAISKCMGAFPFFVNSVSFINYLAV